MSTVRKLWENSNITEEYPSLSGKIRFDEPLRAHTTFKVGGPADIFAEPDSIESLVFLLDRCAVLDIPVSLLGGGSNVLVSDRGIRGLVVSLARFADISGPSVQSGDSLLVQAECGASMRDLTDWCQIRGIAGLERFAGLPGSVGGAVFMNARCYDISMADVFFSARVLYFQKGGCTLETWPLRREEWDYKTSPFQQRTGPDPLVLSPGASVLLSAEFALRTGNPLALRSEMDRWILDRTEKGHYRFPSAGSMFKNNRAFGMPSGKIIDEAGLRGFHIGDAQVAPWHGNIVINAGNATAADLRALVRTVRGKVYDKTGFLLEPEVIQAGDWDE